jgi:5-formyltetrahydrofolate cyclo-ligase
MENSKADWRARLLCARSAIDAGARRTASAAVVERLARLPAFARAAAVLSYDAVGAELDPHALALHAWRAGKHVYHPVAGGAPEWRRIVAEAVSSPPPDGDAPQPPVLLVVPGVGFDLRGTRLGRGGGYYDRAIATLRHLTDVVVIGVGFDTQVVDRLPSDPWDEPVDVLVTERRVLVPATTGERAVPPGGTP